MAHLDPLKVWLSQEEIDALDRACGLLGLAGSDGRFRFIRRCLLYGLLSLRDAGVLTFPDADAPAFVREYNELEILFAAEGDSVPEVLGEPLDTDMVLPFSIPSRCRSGIE